MLTGKPDRVMTKAIPWETYWTKINKKQMTIFILYKKKIGDEINGCYLLLY